MKNEIASKAVLEQYGIRTTHPALVRSAAEAAREAARLGGPLAVKIVSPAIVHKAAAGGVRLGVAADGAAAAFEAVMAACRAAHPDAPIDGVLLEEMVAGDHEVFIGARVDAEYGAVVLFGLGGGDVERRAAPAAALAPIDRTGAQTLVSAVFPRGADGGRAIGQAAFDTLADYLMAVAGPQGMIARGDADELDINPVVVGASGCVAVDAVVHAGGRAPGLRDAGRIERAIAGRRAGLEGLRALFDPEAIAFIGASTSPGKLGYRSIKNLVDYGYRGRLYPIHPKAAEIAGVPAYPSILDVPGPVDRAYVAVGVEQVPATLADCARKGVRVAQVLTAGFTEFSGDDAARGRDLEARMLEAIASTSMRVVGPNCIGTFSATSRIAMGAARYCPEGETGVAFISQSGTFAGDVVRRAQVQGIAVSRVLSCGNCSDLDLADYLLFCEQDPHTTLIAFYTESIRNAGLFFRIAQQVSKPVVVFKGGTTAQGIHAASSHTAALSTDSALWQAAVAQAGILQVGSIDDLMDAFLMHCAHGRLAGNRLAIFGSGGGVSVTSSDTAALAGMVVPPLAPATAERLRQFGMPGTSVANPIDIPVWSLWEQGRPILGGIVDHLKRDPGVDGIIVYIEMGSIMDFADDEDAGLRALEALCASVQEAGAEGPKVSLVLRSTGDATQDDFVRRQRAALVGRGIPVFNSTSRAVRAHAGLWRLSQACGERAAAAVPQSASAPA